MSAVDRNGLADAFGPFDAERYISVHGPRVGDRVLLGDSGLIAHVDFDSQHPGDEFLAGFGKTARDGLHLKAAAVRDILPTSTTKITGVWVSAATCAVEENPLPSNLPSYRPITPSMTAMSAPVAPCASSAGTRCSPTKCGSRFRPGRPVAKL